jgi:hypothetical protein
MSRHDEADLVRLSAEILRYLRMHPQVADTVDGIVEWWLPWHRRTEAINRVQQALDELVARGLINQVIPIPGRF